MNNTTMLIVGSGKSYHVQKWANEFAKKGYLVHIFTINKVEREFHKSVNIHDLSRSNWITRIFRFRNLAARLAINNIHYHSAGKYSIFSFFSPKKYRSIIYVYGSDVYLVPLKSFFHRFAVKRILSKADVIVSASFAMKLHVNSLFGFFQKIRVIPFGVDRTKFSQNAYSVKNKVTRIGIVKKLEPVYGIDLLIRAFARLKLSMPYNHLELLIVGSGSQLKYLQSLTNEFDLDSCIKFSPAVPNDQVPNILKSFDLFVVPSRSESFGVAAVEALSMGIPTVVSNVGGLPEVVANGRAGKIFKSDDVESLTLAMSEMIDSFETRVKYSDEGIKWVRNNFDLNINLEQLEDLHSEFN